MHLRRRDYIHAHPDAVPNIPHAVQQINQALNKYQLKMVFVATDGSDEGKAVKKMAAYISHPSHCNRLNS